MPDDTSSFQYDVFLSHSAKDKAVVRPLAERSKKDGRMPSSQLSTLNSQLFTGSDWAQLESDTLRTGHRPFRDPLNKERRFLPLRLATLRDPLLPKLLSGELRISTSN